MKIIRQEKGDFSWRENLEQPRKYLILSGVPLVCRIGVKSPSDGIKSSFEELDETNL